MVPTKSIRETLARCIVDKIFLPVLRRLFFVRLHSQGEREGQWTPWLTFVWGPDTHVPLGSRLVRKEPVDTDAEAPKYSVPPRFILRDENMFHKKRKSMRE